MGTKFCMHGFRKIEVNKELIYKLPLSRKVRASIFAWIEGYYNKKRSNTTNKDNMSPLKKREAYYKHHLAA